jgi:hypothetical protein
MNSTFPISRFFLQQLALLVKALIHRQSAKGAHLFLAGSAHCAPTRGTIFLPEKVYFQKLLQVTRHQRITDHGPPPQKRTDSKKGPSFDPFGRKTGVGFPKKSILFCAFSRFSGIFARKWLSVSLFRYMDPSQKIVPKNLP